MPFTRPLAPVAARCPSFMCVAAEVPAVCFHSLWFLRAISLGRAHLCGAYHHVGLHAARSGPTTPAPGIYVVWYSSVLPFSATVAFLRALPRFLSLHLYSSHTTLHHGSHPCLVPRFLLRLFCRRGGGSAQAHPGLASNPAALVSAHTRTLRCPGLVPRHVLPRPFCGHPRCRSRTLSPLLWWHPWALS